MQSFLFYQHHLARVSRSFSYCIEILSSPAREWVALSYLLLRIVDIIEDSEWLDKQQQMESFKQFKSFLYLEPSKKAYSEWITLFPHNIPAEEQLLVQDLALFIQDLGKTPEEIKKSIILVVEQMIDGMIYFLNQYTVGKKLILPTLESTENYCFIVAGMVGQLLTAIFNYYIEGFPWSISTEINSIHFGLFLQKINLLKDKERDESAGKYYISSREELRESINANKRNAMDYLKSIPIIAGREYRLFCAWSLFIGLASLKWLDKNWLSKQNLYKIKMPETHSIISQINSLIDDNSALETLFQSY